MGLRLADPKLIMAMIVSIVMVAALACGAADEEEDTPAAPTAVPPAAAAAPTTPPPTPTSPPPTATPVIAAALLTGFSRVLVQPAVAPPSASAFSDIAADPNQRIAAVLIGKKSGVAPWREGGEGRMYSIKVFSPLFNYDHNNEVRQGVAVGYDLSDDLTSYIIHLDKDAVFHDGTPVTAASVKAAWEFGASPDQQVAWGGSLRLLDKVVGFNAVAEGDATSAAGLVAVDDNTLRIDLVSARPTFPMELAAWTLGIFKAEQAMADENWEQKPIGVGPFEIESWNPDTGKIKINAASTWWRDKPSIQGIDIIHVQDKQTQLIMYENGEIDIVLASIGFQPTLHYPDHKFFDEVYVMPSGGIWRFAFRQQDPPFDDLEVRKALSHGVDMEAIVKAIFGPAAVWATGNVMPQVSCHNPTRKGYFFDVAKAQGHMAASKYGADASKWPLIKVSASRPQFVRVAVALQEQWKDNLGVTNMEVIKLEPGQSAPEGRNLRRTSGATPLPGPDGIAGRFYLSRNQKSYRPEWPELDAKVEAALVLPLDTPNRCSIFQKLEDEYMDSYPWIPVLWGIKAWLVSPWIIGFEASIDRDFNSLNFMKIKTRDRSLYQ